MVNEKYNRICELDFNEEGDPTLVTSIGDVEKSIRIGEGLEEELDLALFLTEAANLIHKLSLVYGKDCFTVIEELDREFDETDFDKTRVT
jgi:hypothetical protein